MEQTCKSEGRDDAEIEVLVKIGDAEEEDLIKQGIDIRPKWGESKSDKFEEMYSTKLKGAYRWL